MSIRAVALRALPLRFVVPACAAALVFAGSAEAQDVQPAAAVPVMAAAEGAAADPWAAQRASFERARAGWIGECRRRYVATYAERREGPGLAGLLVGGLVGGLAGYGIAGEGDRAIGTVAGAVVGAVAGGALDRSGRKNRNAGLLDAADEYCASYFDYYTQGALQPGYAPPFAHGHGHGQPMMMAPAPAPVAQPDPAPRCTEEVTYEDVDVPVRSRSIPPRARPRGDKRQRMD